MSECVSVRECERGMRSAGLCGNKPPYETVEGRSGLRAQGAFDHTGWDTHTSYAKYSGNEPVECVCRVGELTIRQESARAGVRRGAQVWQCLDC